MATDASGNSETYTVELTFDTANLATFNIVNYEEGSNILEIKGLSNIEENSIFNLKKLIYSDAEGTVATHTLNGEYVLVASLEDVDTAGEYFYKEGTLKVILTASDSVTIEGLAGFDSKGTVGDNLTALKGWNIDPSSNEAEAVNNIGITVTPEQN